MRKADIDPAYAVALVQRRRESQRRITAAGRARDRKAGLRLVQIKVPEEGVEILRQFALWLSGGPYERLAEAMKIREEYIGKLSQLDTNYIP